MNERDKFLLKAGYVQGYLNASYTIHDGGRLIGNLQDESERWVEEPIADNGGTLGQYISHDAPSDKGAKA